MTPRGADGEFGKDFKAVVKNVFKELKENKTLMNVQIRNLKSRKK